MTRSVTTVFLLLIALSAAGAAFADEPSSAAADSAGTLSLASYISSLDHVLHQLETGGADALPAVRRSLPDAWRVQHRGQVVEVSLAWLGKVQANLGARPKERDALMGQAIRRLRHMREEAQRWAGLPYGGSSTARERLDAILARPEFSGVAGPNWLDRLRARIMEWIATWLGRLLEQFGDFSLAGGVLMWALITLVLILAAIWGFRALRRPSPEPALGLKGPAAEKLSWRRWAQQALASAASGDYRLAIHHLYWAFIYRMEDLGAWQLDRARTHREYLRLLAREHQHRASLDTITRRFEAVWYGRQPATQEDFREAAASLERLGCMLGSIPATGRS